MRERRATRATPPLSQDAAARAPGARDPRRFAVGARGAALARHAVTMDRSFSVLALALTTVTVAFPTAGCKAPEEDVQRIATSLGSEGYALFEVDPGSSDRVAVVVELRSAPPGTYVLLHSPDAPASVGWFALDVGAYAPCRRYGEKTVDEVALDCLLPDGHGAIVDLASVGEGRLFRGDEEDPASARTEITTLLRHDTRRATPRGSSSASSSTTRGAFGNQYYAVMRVEPMGDGVRAAPSAIPFAIEVRALDDASGATSSRGPTIERIQ